MPMKKRPITARTTRPSRGVLHDRSGSAMSRPAKRVEEDCAGGAERPGETGGEDSPKALSEDPDDDCPSQH